MVSDKEAKMGIKDYLKSKVPQVEKEIENYIPRKATKKWIEDALGKTQFELDLDAYTKGVNEPIWDLLDRGGKRFRPIMTSLCAEAVGGDAKKALKLAPMVELIHNGCVEEDALVWMADGTPKKMKDVQIGDYVLSVDKLGRIKERRVSYKHDNGVKKVLKVVSNNRTLSATEEHPFLTVAKSQPMRFKIKKVAIAKLRENAQKNGKTISEIVEEACTKAGVGYSPKALKNALYGYPHCLLPEEFVDYLEQQYEMNIEIDFCKVQCVYEKAEVRFKWVRAKNLTKGEILVAGKNVYPAEGVLPQLPSFAKSNRDRYSLPVVMTKELAQFCGALVGDGHISGGRVSMCIPKEKHGRAEYEQLVKTIFGVEPSKYDECLTICSTAVEKFFDTLGFKENHSEIHIPNWVFLLPREHKLAFVKGYIDTDGHVNKAGYVCFDCGNKPLMEELKMLLDSTGFVTSNINSHIVSNTHFQNAIKKESLLHGFDVSSSSKISNEIGTSCEVFNSRLSRLKIREVVLRQEEKVPSMPEELSFEKLGFVEVQEIIEDAPVQTYDIEVEDTHSYICNGVVVHNTLMQDDVEDDSAARRGKPCTHKVFGVDTAVNTGTIMFYWPLMAIKENWFKLNEKERMNIYDLYASELLRVCSGQAWDIAWHHGGFTPNEKQYLNMCLSKTGVLTKFACQLGAIAGGATKAQYVALGDFGQIVGVGFQIQDDILELTEQDFKKGKGSLGGDIHEGKRTLIIIRTLEKAHETDKARLVEILDSHTTEEKIIQEALDIIGRYDGIDYSKKKANALVTKAWKKLDKTLPKSNAKEMLKKFAEYLVDRKM